MEELTLEKFEEASELVKDVTTETKLVYSEYFSAQTGNKVFFKPENMQYTGAYKVRGAYYKIHTLTEEEKSKGLITASAGNHAPVSYTHLDVYKRQSLCAPSMRTWSLPRLSWRKSLRNWKMCIRDRPRHDCDNGKHRGY